MKLRLWNTYGTVQDLKQLLPELISLQKSSGNLEDIFASMENPGIDLKVFRGMHELITFVVSRSLGKIMNQVPRHQGRVLMGNGDME